MVYGDADFRELHAECTWGKIVTRARASSRDAFFSVLIVLWLGLCGGCALLQVFGLCSANDASVIVVENRVREQPDAPTAENVQTRIFQNSVEGSMRDALPFYDGAAMTKACLERHFIKASAGLLLESDASYPTFYGSRYAYDPRSDSVVPFPAEKAEDLNIWLPAFSKAINEFADLHPGIRVIYCEPTHMAFSATNPLIDFTSGLMDRTFVEEHVNSLLAPNVFQVDLQARDAAEYDSWFYRSEHHWKTEGAFEAYKRILDVATGGAEKPLEVENIKFRIPFYGSYTRMGLCEPEEPDSIDDVLYPESNFKIVIGGLPVLMENIRHRELYDSGRMSPERYTLRYEEYFHWNLGRIDFLNNNNRNGKTLLIVADSYSNCIERLLAEHYEKVVCVDPRVERDTIELLLLREQKIDDVLFMMCPIVAAQPRVVSFISN
ncbi:DHHW family protein [Adlercreutzia sp. R25]|uniref:DHHW family protein n=1 Tax=Adlercreutzia shanghongiae TaxID=3111773 RepID=UPI002DB6F26A|nr:DHHW family protein [Adlercreutzia sp. R25]MEC4273885.1 DHHW family protein [Adlercreutzia sp. R25]